MGIESIHWGLPFCGDVEEQTECSLITRTAFVGMGGIALLVGIFALSGIPGLNALGTSEGIILSSLGGLTLLIALCIRCVKRNIEKGEEQNAIAPENQLSRCKNTKHLQFQEKNIESISPQEILVIIFQTLNIEKIPVVARVCIAWYCAIKQNALWMFYFRRDHELSFYLKKAHSTITSHESISYELEYKKQKLNQVFTQLVSDYRDAAEPRFGDILGEYERSVLDHKWQKLAKFAERYPEFKNILPKKIIVPSIYDEPKPSFLWQLDRAIGLLFYNKK